MRGFGRGGGGGVQEDLFATEGDHLFGDGYCVHGGMGRRRRGPIGDEGGRWVREMEGKMVGPRDNIFRTAGGLPGGIVGFSFNGSKLENRRKVHGPGASGHSRYHVI